MSDYFLIARISSVYGKNGYVRVISFSDFPDHFYSLKKVYIDFFGNKKEFIIEESKKVKDFFVFKFKNFDNENDAGVLVNKDIFVDNENLVKLPENYFFIHDLVGSVVLKNDAEFGIVRDVLIFPANNVYVIDDKQGNEILIPAVGDFIESFDPQKKILILQPGKDLYDDEN